MVELVGLEQHEETLVNGLIAQFAADDFTMGELRRVEKCPLPGYNGKVEPVACEVSDRFHMTMKLASVSPFTLAHELAHVSDISTRRQETRDHLSLAMPTGWHLAHRMSSEYYANRVACLYTGEADIFPAFQNDCAGFRRARESGDWAGFLIHYALLTGIMHGMKRFDCDPIHLLGHVEMPEAVAAAIGDFAAGSDGFFATYGAEDGLARAA